MLKQLSINVPWVEVLEQMPGYAKFMKDLVTKKRLVTFGKMIDCSIVVHFYKIPLTIERRSGCVHYSLYSWVIKFCESIADLGQA